MFTDASDVQHTELKLMPNHRLNLRSLRTFLTVDDETFERLQKRFESMVRQPVSDLKKLSRGLAPSSPLSFCQSSPFFFLQADENGVFSKLFVDTTRFLW